ncbi:MAG: AzlC family ABC transporter permease [Acutalibacteraceae bacterium]|nr:AzlC family ABC transporter permease [Acutalibacteraceae bacterium]
MINFRKGLRDGIPIALGYLSVSFTFGLQAVNGNLSWWEAVLISFTNLTSAGQFAGLDIMIRGGGFWLEMACTQFIINIRYALMSLSLSQKVDGSVKGIHRFLTGFGITDEIFAVSMGNDKPVNNKYLYGLIILPLLGWVSGTFLGAVAGQVLPEVVRSSLSLAIYGMFIAIIIPPAKKNKAVMKVIIISVLLSCVFKWIPVLSGVSSGFVIIICTVISATVGAILFPVKEDKQ